MRAGVIRPDAERTMDRAHKVLLVPMLHSIQPNVAKVLCKWCAGSVLFFGSSLGRVVPPKLSSINKPQLLVASTPYASVLNESVKVCVALFTWMFCRSLCNRNQLNETFATVVCVASGWTCLSPSWIPNCEYSVVKLVTLAGKQVKSA